MTNALYECKDQGVKKGQLCSSFPSKENKIFSTVFKVKADAVISFPFFKHKTISCLAMFIYHCQSAGLHHPKEAIIPWKPLLLGGLLPKPQKLGPGLVRSRYNF